LSALVSVLSEKENNDQEENLNVSPTDYINVISLLPYPLNISTQPFGRGSTYKFQSFGEQKRIIYSHLSEIIENHRNFLEYGYFFILNPKVIRLHGLDDLYKKILTKEKIEEILNGTDIKVITTLFESCNDPQRDIIITMLVERMRDNPASVDLNIVDKISRMAKVNIQERAEDARKILHPEKDDEKE